MEENLSGSQSNLPEQPPQLSFSPPPPGRPLPWWWQVQLGAVILLMLFLAFNLVSDRYGRFWERKPVAPPTPTAKITPSVTPPLGIKLSCPVPPEFCAQGKEISGGEGFFGSGFNLPPGTSLLSIFAGRVEDEPVPPGRSPTQPLLYLRNFQGEEAIYSFYGTPSVSLKTQVLGRTEIGKIGEGSFPPQTPFTGLNFVFSLKKDGKYQKITTGDFGR